MNGRRARAQRDTWSFTAWALRSGERHCTNDHRTVCAHGEQCPTCKART